jgi:hypothetical protein
MQARIKTAGLLAIAGATALGLISPPLAGAASSAYPTNEEARSFHQSDGGWHGSTSFGGLCVPGVNCPTVTNDHVGSGGAGGQDDGYLRTRIGSLLGVGATSRGIYQSPSFVYQGAAGSDPAGLALRLKRRSSLGTLLAVTGNSAEYSVDLVDLSQGSNATSVIDAKPIGDQDSWRTHRVSVPPGSMTLGDSYRIRITSEFQTGVQVVPGGSVGYDDVVLEAKPMDSGAAMQHLARRVRRGLGPAVQRGKALKVRVRCPRSVRPHKCKIRLAASLKRNGPKVTNVRRARVGAGKKRNIRLRVKHAHSKRVAHRRRILVIEKVRVGDRRITVIKRVPIIRH